jgi:hypothetical protein
MYIGDCYCPAVVFGFVIFLFIRLGQTELWLAPKALPAPRIRAPSFLAATRKTSRSLKKNSEASIQNRTRWKYGEWTCAQNAKGLASMKPASWQWMQ